MPNNNYKFIYKNYKNLNKIFIKSILLNSTSFKKKINIINKIYLKNKFYSSKSFIKINNKLFLNLKTKRKKV